MDNPHNPNLEGGLIPDEEAQINPDLVTGDTPDTFDTPVENEPVSGKTIGNEARKSSYPGDTEFEEDLEEEEIRRYDEG